MLGGCIYPVIDSLLPSIIDGDQKVLRLQDLCAWKILEEKATIHYFLKKTPAHLFTGILRALLRQHFYKYNNEDWRTESLAYSLFHLVAHWPHENLILRKIFQSCLSPKRTTLTSWIPASGLGPLDHISYDFKVFCSKVAHLLIKSLLKKKKSSSNPLGRNSLKRLDASGCCDEVGIEGFRAKDLIKSITQTGYVFLENDNDKIELTTDVWVRDDEDLAAMWDLIELSKQAEFGVIVYFRNVSFFMLSSHFVTRLFQPLGNIRTSYIEVLSCGFSDDTLQNLSSDLPYLLGLSLTSCPQITNLNPLSSMYNLEQLSLANINLNGKLAPLCSLLKGLYYLNLARCNMSREDLKLLGNSIHSTSVLQLNLSANDFSYELDFAGLISLCRTLKNIEVLVLRNCRLHMATKKLMDSFSESLKELYNLSLIRLEYNDFSCETLTSYLVKVGTNPSLRCVSLAIPTDISNEAEKIKELRTKVYELINQTPESHVCVTWQRPATVLLV